MDLYFAVTEKGYMATSLFKSIVVQFLAISISRHPNREVRSSLNRVGARLQASLVCLCLLRRLCHTWLPAHCFQFCQPAVVEQVGLFLGSQTVCGPLTMVALSSVLALYLLWP